MQGTGTVLLRGTNASGCSCKGLGWTVLLWGVNVSGCSNEGMGCMHW